jgi:hypothetical protein
MKQKSGPDKAPAEQVLKNIRRQTRRKYSAEEKIRIVLEGLRGEENISELCRRGGGGTAPRAEIRAAPTNYLNVGASLRHGQQIARNSSWQFDPGRG